MAKANEAEVAEQDVKPRSTIDPVSGDTATRYQADGGPDRSALLPHVMPVVPGYEIEAKIGEGGMGVVYLARNLMMNRREVLKGRRFHVRSLAVTTDIPRADTPVDQDFLWRKATKVRLWRSRAAQEEEAHPQLLVDDGDGNRGARLGEPSLSRAE